MEQIETQASDLRFLAQAPVALSDNGSVSYGTPQPRPQHSPDSASFGDNSAHASNKRKSVDDGPTSASKQTRSKRNRYISIACNECKRRKIKCNGETPCQRCGNLNLACLYAPNCCSSTFKDSDEFKQVTSQISRLQDEVSWLSQTVRTLQPDFAKRAASTDRLATQSSASAATPSPSQSSSVMPRPDTSRTRTASFRGPTSLAFSLDVANNTISNMGYSGLEEADSSDQPGGNDMPVPVPGAPYDPLLEFSKDDMIRLCRLHEDEIGIMYPVLDAQVVIEHAKIVASYLESSRNSNRLPDIINDEKTLELKMMMCCALVVESHGHSEKAIRLYDTMEAIVNRKLMSDTIDVANLPLLCLLAGYRFLSNDEILAWRVIGQVVRLCLELGIHQRTGLMKIQDESERKNALHSFWSAYVLDRRWAFGTGLPFALQDDEIDPKLPFPEGHPFLVAMITYSRIGAKVWRQVSHFEPILARELRQEEIDGLDREILQWYESVPEEVRVRYWDREKSMASTPSYNLQRLRIWTYLRLNQMRIWLYTPFLHSATSIMSNPAQAQRVVDLAKDTIQYLHQLNNTTNLYRRVQAFYHQFLTSAISVVFLASVHAPVRFSAVCREEFYMALELVKDLSAKSWVSKRLWRTISSLKDVAPKFGLNPDDDPHSNAALGMIGLARGHMDQRNASSPYSTNPPMPPMPLVPANDQTVDQNGKKIQTELSRIFEGYVGLNGFQYSQTDGPTPQPHQDLTPGANGAMYSQDGTIFSHLREMF